MTTKAPPASEGNENFGGNEQSDESGCLYNGCDTRCAHLFSWAMASATVARGEFSYGPGRLTYDLKTLRPHTPFKGKCFLVILWKRFWWNPDTKRRRCLRTFVALIEGVLVSSLFTHPPLSPGPKQMPRDLGFWTQNKQSFQKNFNDPKFGRSGNARGDEDHNSKLTST